MYHYAVLLTKKEETQYYRQGFFNVTFPVRTTPAAHNKPSQEDFRLKLTMTTRLGRKKRGDILATDYSTLTD